MGFLPILDQNHKNVKLFSSFLVLLRTDPTKLATAHARISVVTGVYSCIDNVQFGLCPEIVKFYSLASFLFSEFCEKRRWAFKMSFSRKSSSNRIVKYANTASAVSSSSRVRNSFKVSYQVSARMPHFRVSKSANRWDRIRSSTQRNGNGCTAVADTKTLARYN